MRLAVLPPCLRAANPGLGGLPTPPPAFSRLSTATREPARARALVLAPLLGGDLSRERIEIGHGVAAQVLNGGKGHALAPRRLSRGASRVGERAQVPKPLPRPSAYLLLRRQGRYIAGAISIAKVGFGAHL